MVNMVVSSTRISRVSMDINLTLSLLTSPSTVPYDDVTTATTYSTSLKEQRGATQVTHDQVSVKRAMDFLWLK